MLPRRSLLLAPLGAALATSLHRPAWAARDTVVIGASSPVPSLDPHISNTTSYNALGRHVFDRLIQQDASGTLRPGLATEWKAVSNTVWEFHLRPGVTWHDGRDFTADDVLFTFERLPSAAGGFVSVTRPIAKAEATDPLTLRIETKQPYPLLPNDLAALAIIARHAAEGAAPEDWNNLRAAIGTGPYRYAAFQSGDRAELVRNERYWGGVEPWAKVTYRFIGNDGARTAALLAGDVDLIDQVPSTDLARLKRDSRLSVTQSQGVRLIYLQTDFSREVAPPGVSAADGKPLERNPFLDVRVRRALTLAIDRQALADRVMEGTASPTGQWLPPGSYSYHPEIPVPTADAEAARRLLAEAGFPEGLRVTLSTPNDRYPNDAKVCQAVAQMWTRIGVRTTVEAVPWSVYLARGQQQAYGVRLGGWGSSTGEASYLLRNVLSTYSQGRGSANFSRYSNPELDALTERAVVTLDDAQREAILRQATKLAIEDVGLIPLFLLGNSWASRKELHYEARRDEFTLAANLRPAG
ncbi:ABC transporter, substrate-binding protein, family 5 [Acetobacteraceae bacterium AT-5844]|nr:ABC transporter, substrate-binding protein, family 5 [Acetobacteraceae bacterium AT-5844]